MKKKGWIALDIDGTITLEKHSIPPSVITYLKTLSLDGWQLAFATGRSFKFASLALSSLDFPFYFLPQNGSVVLKMPERLIVEKKYITDEDLNVAETACQGLDADFLVYAGFEEKDLCYYRPNRFSSEEQKYIEELKSREGDNWQTVDSFPVSTFPLIKYFGSTSKMKMVVERLEPYFHATQIRDPFIKGIDIVLVTHKDVSKGLSLTRLIEKEGRGDFVIVAGDDSNDLSLFEVADFKIAMPHAPAILLEKADLIASPTSEFGIINALAKAIHENN